MRGRSCLASVIKPQRSTDERLRCFLPVLRELNLADVTNQPWRLTGLEHEVCVIQVAGAFFTVTRKRFGFSPFLLVMASGNGARRHNLLHNVCVGNHSRHPQPLIQIILSSHASIVVDDFYLQRYRSVRAQLNTVRCHLRGERVSCAVAGRPLWIGSSCRSVRRCFKGARARSAVLVVHHESVVDPVRQIRRPLSNS